MILQPPAAPTAARKAIKPGEPIKPSGVGLDGSGCPRQLTADSATEERERRSRLSQGGVALRTLTSRACLRGGSRWHAWRSLCGPGGRVGHRTEP